MTNQDDKKIHNQIAIFLKAKRLAMGLTLRQFSELIYEDDKNSGYLSNIENNKRQITIDTFGFLLEKLNCRIEIIED